MSAAVARPAQPLATVSLKDTSLLRFGETMIKKISLLLLFVFCMASASIADEIDIYIAAGQSNMDGLGRASDLDANDPFRLPQPNARIWYANPAAPGTNETSFSSNGWQALEPGYTAVPDSFGPALSFASAIRAATGTENDIGIIKVSKGGTSIQESIGEWHGNPNDNPGYLFNALIAETNLALAALEANGDTGIIRGVIWHQGESDGGFNSYIVELEELIAGVRGELGIPDLPFVAGEISHDIAGFQPFNQNLADFVNDPNSVNLGLASSLGLITTDLLHFDTASQITLGREYANALAPILNNTTAQSNSLYLEDYRTNQNVLYEFGTFASNPTATSFSSTGLSTNIPASLDTFGGIGIAPTSSSVDLTGTTRIEIVARVNVGNASDLIISIREAPDSTGQIGEFFSYRIAAERLQSADGGFVRITIDPGSGFNGDQTDGVLNGILNDTSIQTPVAGTSAQSYTVQSINFLGSLPDAPQDCVAAVTLHGALSVSGTRIVDQNGNVVRFAGNSFFWSNTGFGGEQFYTAGAVQWLQQDWHSMIVRAAMGVEEVGGYLTDPQGNVDRVTTVVDAAIANDMYVIIDWHSHDAENHEAEAINFFRSMAERYGDTPNVIYEIYNEPIHVSWSDDVKPYAEAVIAAIREIDPDNLIIVGSPTWSQDVDIASLDPITGFSNIAYTLHFYAGTHGEYLREKARTAMDNGLALFVSEWGTVNADGDGEVDEVSTEQWLQFLDEHDLSHLNWSVNHVEEGASVLHPNASGVGGWTFADLTPSGRLVRDIVREWNGCVEVAPVLLGDSNQDGFVNFLDIAAFIEVLTNGGFLEEADCNEDGIVNFLDVTSFITILTGA